MNQNNKDELYHYGVLGMRWGRRNAIRTSSISERKAKRFEKIKEKSDKMIADNDRRVQKHGKTSVKVADKAMIASTIYGATVGVAVIKRMGMASMNSIAKNPNMGNIALHTASILTVAGMGAVTISSLKRVNTLRNDIKLANQYEYRKYIKQQSEK